MTRFKNYFYIVLSTLAFNSCGTQGNVSTPGTGDNFEKLIYHSSRCNGTCPQIDFQVDSTRTIIVNREYFVSKGGTDSARSGHFKGVLDPINYAQLLKILDSVDYKNLKFPDIQCCDGIIKTIIVYSAGSRTYLKSMTPPPEASAFISFLHKLGTDTKLTKTAEEFNIEE
jgi:Domain of unknown function (DUF6438)